MPQGYAGSTVEGINDSGLIVGFALNLAQNSDFAAVWTASSNPLIIGGAGSYALAVNSRGEVAGGALDGSGFTQVFTWTQQHGMTFRGTFPGGSNIDARAINAAGELAGWGNGTLGCCGDRAFFYSENGGFLRIDPPSPYDLSYASGLNNRGDVVGSFQDGSEGVPFIFNTSTNQLALVSSSLDVVPGAAMAINNSDWLVGTSTSGGFLYVNGESYLLSDLVQGWSIGEAVDINSAGQILAYGTNGQMTGALLLTRTGTMTATPELGSFTYLAMGFGLLLIAARFTKAGTAQFLAAPGSPS